MASLSTVCKLETRTGALLSPDRSNDGVTMMDAVNKNRKLFCFLGAVTSGLLIGIFWSWMADSGEVHIARAFVTCVVAMCSYLLAFTLLNCFGKTPATARWLSVSVMGSIVCALNLRVIKFLVDNWQYRQSRSALEYLISQLPEAGVRFSFTAPIFILVALAVMFTIQAIGRQFQR